MLLYGADHALLARLTQAPLGWSNGAAAAATASERQIMDIPRVEDTSGHILVAAPGIVFRTPENPSGTSVIAAASEDALILDDPCQARLDRQRRTAAKRVTAAAADVAPAKAKKAALPA